MTIGIIEDDSLLNQALEIALQNAGYYTISAHTRKEALDLFRKKVDAFFIDIGLPDGNGIELYQELQMEKRIPAIFLTARDEEKEMLLAFDAGAQDYVVKPFSMKVLMKRLEVVLKRNPEERYMVGELTLYPDRKQVFTGKTEISLTAKEYQLLEYLMRNQGQVLTKENILETIWGVDGQFVVDNTVSVTINRLRRKIEPDGERQGYIQNGVSDWRERAMRWETVALLVFGFLCGMTVMYILNRRQRIQEFNKIAEITEDILNERKVQAFSTGEETLYSKLEHQLVRVQEMLQGRSEEAERSRDEIQKLISQIAHQMRTPLMNMETYIGFLEDGKEQMSEELFFQSVDALKNSQGKLGFLVESFIRMARLEQHILQIKKEEPDLLKTVRNGFGQIQRRAEEKEIQFQIMLPEQVTCLHDPNWLGEAFYNILDNAVKYSEYKGLIKVDVQQKERFVKIQVRDYGIEPGEENAVFQRFYRGKRVTTQDGFGIGLYLAREIVSRHQGFLMIRRKDKGVLIEINLPSGLLEVC